jgi:hypothetical protein
VSNEIPVLRCAGCGKRPAQLSEYVDRAKAESDVYACVEEVVELDEGTYDAHTELFLCTDCYIEAGMPLRDHLADVYQLTRAIMGDWTEDPEYPEEAQEGGGSSEARR